MDLCMVGEQNILSLLGVGPDDPFAETIYLNEVPTADDLSEPAAVNSTEQIDLNQKSQRKRKCKVLEPDKSINDKANSRPFSKRTRVKGDVQRNSNSKNSKKQQTIDLTTEIEESSAALNMQSSSSYSSEDDSIASQEFNGGTGSGSEGSTALNSNGKRRASRGSATDLQSLYARKRRERINQQLRILQNLVANGTKVDISTMLEEAVQYVKFLQLQVKLLSSDDLWMYAPIAYNGMDIGLNSEISSPK